MDRQFKVTKRQKKPKRPLTAEEQAQRAARAAEVLKERQVEEEKQQVIDDRVREFTDRVEDCVKCMAEKYWTLEDEIERWAVGMEYAFVNPDYITDRVTRDEETINRRR
ncbi:hypothetical protein JCM5353_001000 [Sporobolomyces roseus]